MPDNDDKLVPGNELDGLINEGMKILNRMDDVGPCYISDLPRVVNSYQAKIGVIGMLVELRARVLKERIQDETTSTDELVLLLNAIEFLRKANETIRDAIEDK